jgi:hypothetical protein
MEGKLKKEDIMAIYRSKKYGSGAVNHPGDASRRTVDFVRHASGPISQKFSIADVNGQDYFYMTTHVQSFFEALELALEEHAKSGYPAPRECGVIGEGKPAGRAGAQMVCLLYRHTGNGTWQVRKVGVWPEPGIEAYATALEEELNPGPDPTRSSVDFWPPDSKSSG